MRRPLLVASCLVTAALATSRDARAGIFLGAELDAGQGLMPSGTPPTMGVPLQTLGAGVGFLGTLGYRIGIGPVFLQPEVQAGYLLFPVPGTDGTHVARAFGGARFGWRNKFEPSIFAHVGVGWLDSNTNGIATDVGLALAFHLIPLLSFGGQVGYNVVTLTDSGSATRWVGYGLHVAVEI